MTDQPLPQDSSANDDWDAIARFVAGESTPEESAAMRRMLAADPARAALVRQLGDAFRGSEASAPTAVEVEAALASVLARREESRLATEPRRVPVVSLESYRSRWRDARFRAAAAVIVVAGAGLLLRSVTGSTTTDALSAAPSHFATAVGDIDSLRLSDGSRVLLGQGSELAVAQGFGTASREVTLKGEARFDVVHDGARPFVVHTATATFRDVGTIFSVHSDGADGARVVVSEGAVAVQSKTAGAPVVLKAGDRAVVAREGAVVVERAAASTEDLAWTNGRLVFRDASVEQITADLRRWYGMELRVDSALASRRLTATFERGAATTDVGRVVAAALGGGLKEDGLILRIIPPPPAMPSR